jgi:hypothetical protein
MLNKMLNFFYKKKFFFFFLILITLKFPLFYHKIHIIFRIWKYLDFHLI